MSLSSFRALAASSPRLLWPCALACSWLIGAGPAHAQRVDDGSDRFFSNKVVKPADEGKETIVEGSITSTTFAYTEFGGTPIPDNNTFENYSPAARLFTDIRAQLDARNLSGSTWNLHMDGRVRVSPGCTFKSPNDPDLGIPDAVEQNCRVQSGSLGGNEYDARELYAKRTGKKTDLYIGRQYVSELAATKIDGVRFQYHTNKTWDLIGFAGLNPAKFSRSVLDDYPAQTLANGDPAGGRVLPIAAGLGAGYRLSNVYGSLGAVGVVPLADDRETGLGESLRVFLTDSGYWRASGKLDLFHYLVVDLQSAAGFGVTNASVGANFRPTPGLTVNAGINRVDTETLNSIAQTQLIEVDPDAGAVTPYNYQNVLRIASDSARLGVSLAFAQQRFEVSTSGQVRQREEVTLASADGNTLTVIPATRNAEVMLSFLDRRSVRGLRLGASFMAIFPFGNDTPNRSNAKIAQITGSRMFADERGELEFNVTFLTSQDVQPQQNCINTLTCYGASDIMALSTGGLFFYRFARDWFGMASLSLGYQSLTDANQTAQPANLLLSGFARVAYRF